MRLSADYDAKLEEVRAGMCPPVCSSPFTDTFTGSLALSAPIHNTVIFRSCKLSWEFHCTISATYNAAYKEIIRTTKTHTVIANELCQNSTLKKAAID